MEARLVNTSRGWQEQLVQLNEIHACLASANELERTRVSGGGLSASSHKRWKRSGQEEKKRSRLEGHVGDSLGEHLAVSKAVGIDALHDILQNVANLVCLIEAENEFVRHSVKKILVALSDYLILRAQTLGWCSLLHHIWNVLRSECGKGLVGERGSKRDESVLASHDSVDLKKKWDPVVCGLEILRCILKSYMKEKSTVDENIEAFCGLLEENLFMIVNATCPATCNGGDYFCSERGLVWSALLQLLGTTTAFCDGDAEESSSKLQVSLIEKIGGCIPLIAGVALSRHKHSFSSYCPSSFLRHKVLRLMVSLSRWFETRHDLALNCLRALRKEGADLVGFSLVGDSTFPSDDNLMHSSFLTSFVRTKEEVGKSVPRSATHLQCRALFLLFRTWSLVAKGLDLNQGGHREASNSRKRSNPEDRKVLEDRFPEVSTGIHHHGCNCLQCGNLSEKALKQEANAGVQEWLRLQSDVVSVDELESFSTTFVGLYLDEDDLMIKMLLLLVRMSSSIHGLVDKETLRIATALGPLELFQAFLQALSYDHTVLVDFLISQNTGTLLLQYLMLCSGLFTKPEFYCKTEHPSETGSRGLAKESLNCLSQLKVAIERLHRRKLFPYNPTSLLKRLDMLEEVYHRE